jgi:hypothetical protein
MPRLIWRLTSRVRQGWTSAPQPLQLLDPLQTGLQGDPPTKPVFFSSPKSSFRLEPPSQAIPLDRRTVEAKKKND